MYWPTLRPFGRKSDVTVSDNDPFTAFRREMDRLFESFGRDIGWPTGDNRTTAMTPSIDVSETDSEIKIDADLPGVDEKDVDVVISENVLTIKGEKKAEREEKKKDFHLVERSYGSFSRSLTLPFAGFGQGQGDLQERRVVDQPAQAARGQSQGEEDRDQRHVTGGPRGRRSGDPSGGRPRRLRSRRIERGA